MVVSVSRLRAAGLAKEVTPGTPITTPTRYLNIVPPDGFTPMIDPLPSKGIEALASMYPKITQGPGHLNGMKVKMEVEPDNIGEILQAMFGLDTFAAGTGVTVILNVNDRIDWWANASLTNPGTFTGNLFTCQIPAGFYTFAAMATQIGTSMHAADGTNNYSITAFSTGKFHVNCNSTSIGVLWGTGVHASTSIARLLGFVPTDQTSVGAGPCTVDAQSTPLSLSTHTFKRQNVSALPTYTWWFDKTLEFPLFAGSMADKMELDLKAKGILEASLDWVGLVYDGVDGIAESTAFSTLQPFVWSNAVVRIDGVQKFGYDNMKLTLANSAKADHALNNSIWPYVGYSEGFTPDMAMELFFEDTVQHAKFLAGTTAHVQITLTSTQFSVPYSIDIDIPKWYYKSANLYIPSNGPLKIPFTGMCQYDFGAGYDVRIILSNDVPAQY